MATSNLLAKAALSLSVVALLASCKGEGTKDKKADKPAKDSVAQVLKPGSSIKLDPAKKYIYITWDDGPQPPGTTNCEEVFREEGIKATFFMVGMHQFSPSRERIVDTIRNSYPQFLLANHSHSHGFRDHYKEFYAHPDSAMQDIYLAEKELQVPVKIVRLPGMNSWVENGKIKGPQSSLEVCKRLGSAGYNAVGWDLEWRFGKRSVPIQGAHQMAQEVNDILANQNTYAANAVVILAHDRMFRDQYKDSLRTFIQILKQNPDYVFETIDHYPLIQKGK